MYYSFTGSSLESSNYRVLWILNIFIVFSWWFDELQKGNYDVPSIFANSSLPDSDFRLGDLAEPLENLVQVLRNIDALPPQMFTNFNMTYWQPKIENLLAAYAANSPRLILQTLQMMEPLLRNEEFWSEMKVVLETTSQTLSWLNDKLEELAYQGGNISIVSLLPDINEVLADNYLDIGSVFLSDT